MVVERFGKILGDRAAVLEPGIHLKWPFPISIVYRAPSRQISQTTQRYVEGSSDAKRRLVAMI